MTSVTQAPQGTGLSDAAAAFLSHDLRMHVAGDWVASSSGETIDVVNPSTGMVIGRAQAASQADVERAVAEARAAHTDGRWRKLPPSAQSRALHRLAALLEADIPLLAELESLDVGKPSMGSQMEIAGAIDLLRYYAGWPDKVYGTVNPAGPDMHSYTVRQPVGVVGAIIAWNCPFALAVGKLAPALAFGNAVILKPAEQTNLTATRLVQLCLEAGLPAGAVQLLTGTGETVGDALVAHRGVDKISFTGSATVGRTIARRGAETLKRVTLELGGKNPVLVFPDADLSLAVPTLFSPFGVWYNSGQGCVHGTRFLVHEDIHDDFVAAAVQATSFVKVGAPTLPDTLMGPVASEEHFNKVMGYLEAGTAGGATVACGGSRVGDEGFFINPTIFTGVDNAMTIARDEIFGPVIGVSTFTTEEEALRIANDTEYGLSACLWTNDARRSHRIAAELEAGLVWVNTYAEMNWTVPFGGLKQSGYGREYGAESIGTYTETKSVYNRLAPMQF